MQEQLYPFTKNRYFSKKRMRAVDFERDQAFADHKLAFLNHWVFGTGVALGLGVQRIDSDSLLVEPGLAIDAQGRYLIVDEPAICRIRTLEGFDALQGENAILWLCYEEEQLDPMFVADGEGQSAQYAIAKERFSFSLSEESMLPASAAQRVLLSEHILYEDDELRVVQSIPQILSGSAPCQIRLYVQCFSLEPLELSLHYAPDIPGFSGMDDQPPKLELQMRVEKGESEVSLWVQPVQPAQVTRITLVEGSFTMEKRGVQFGLQNPFQEEFQTVAGSVLTALAARLNRLSPQELWDEQPLGVPIAGIKIIRYEDKALLDDIIPLGVRHQASVPNLQDQLRRVADRFQSDGCINRAEAHPVHPGKADGAHSHPGAPRSIATGSLILNAGGHMKAGNILTSDEITHGLGPGTVYVEFGIEHIYPVANSESNRTDLLLGDVSLFEQASGTYEKDFDRGVRVHPDKGTFELAVRPLADLRQSSLRLRWFAWRTSGEEVQITGSNGILDRLEPDVIHVKPGATVAFTPVFSGGTGSTCDFFVEGKRNGVITRDGIFTAPDRECLCQVYAQVRGKPEERANAFIIVEMEEEGNGQNSI